MLHVGTANNTSSSVRSRKLKRLTYVLNDIDETKHCAGINSLDVLKSSSPDRCDFLFTGSRDGTLKRWDLADEEASCSATFESHVDWVNDAVLVGNTLVSCSSDTTIKTWNCLSDGVCTRTLRQHSDYVICLAAAEKNNNIVASGGLGGEVFIWDIEAALLPITKPMDVVEDESSYEVVSAGNLELPLTSLRSVNSINNISGHNKHSNEYRPVTLKGQKNSVYAVAMNDSGTTLVSGGTEKVIRVWDPRTGSKNMKLRGHTDNIRALLVDSTGRFCLSGSSDSMIRLWDLGQQRCVHAYSVHTDSVWALASNPSFSHVYSGGRDLSLYLTDLSTRESFLLFSDEQPIQQLALQDDKIWVATTSSSVRRWPAEGRNPQKVFQTGGSFVAGNLSFSRSRACLDGPALVPVYKEPSFTIPGIPRIVQHEILNNRRHVLTKDAAGSVKLWEITRGAVIEDYGKVSFEEKKEELFEKVSFPAWFSVDNRLGSLSIHLDAPQCFAAEMHAVGLNNSGESQELKINLAQETLGALFRHWLAKRKQKFRLQASSNGDISSGGDILQASSNGDISSGANTSITTVSDSRFEADGSAENHNNVTFPAFDFSSDSTPSIITEGTCGGPWRKRISDLDGTEDEKDLPLWCVDCLVNGRIPPRENTKSCHQK